MELPPLMGDFFFLITALSTTYRRIVFLSNICTNSILIAVYYWKANAFFYIIYPIVILGICIFHKKNVPLQP